MPFLKKKQLIGIIFSLCFNHNLHFYWLIKKFALAQKLLPMLHNRLHTWFKNCRYYGNVFQIVVWCLRAVWRPSATAAPVAATNAQHIWLWWVCRWLRAARRCANTEKKSGKHFHNTPTLESWLHNGMTSFNHDTWH